MRRFAFPQLGGILRKDGGTSEAEEVIVAKRPRDVGVHVAKLAAVALVEDEGRRARCRWRVRGLP